MQPRPYEPETLTNVRLSTFINSIQQQYSTFRNISLWEILRDSFAIFCNAVMPNTFKHGMTPTHQAK
jgi:hypothetical protein